MAKKNGKALVHKNGKHPIALVQHFSNRVAPPEAIHYLPESAGRKAGIPYVKDNYLRDEMNQIFGRGKWNMEVPEKSDTEMLIKCGRAVVTVRISFWIGKNKTVMESVGEADAEFYTDKNQRTRIANDPYKSAQTDGFKKILGDYLALAANVYDGQVEKKEKQETKITVDASGVMNI